MKKMGRSLVKFIIAVLVIVVVIAAAVIASKSGGKDSLDVSDLQTAVSAPGASLSTHPGNLTDIIWWRQTTATSCTCTSRRSPS